ncbi:MAG: DMT family transporter [Actinomycetales bacterium]
MTPLRTRPDRPIGRPADAPGATRAGRSVYAQFGFLALVWGSSFLFIKVGLRGLSVAQVAAGRIWLGAVALVVIALLGRRGLPRELVVYAHMLVVAMLLCVAPFTLFAYGETHISSGLASIFNATTPLLTMLVASIFLPQERPTATKLLGLAMGFGGVLLVMAPWRGVGGGSLLGELACLGATTCYAFAFVYLRRFVLPRRLDPIAVALLQVGLAALVFAVLAPFVAADPVSMSWPVVWSMLALGVAGTGVAFWVNVNVVMGLGATAASTVTYLTPVVGVLLGVVVLDESLSWNEPLGAVLVVAGIALGQGLLQRRRPTGG